MHDVHVGGLGRSTSRTVGLRVCRTWRAHVVDVLLAVFIGVPIDREYIVGIYLFAMLGLT